MVGTSTVTTDAIEQHARRLTDASRTNLRALLLEALRDAPALAEPPWVLTKAFASSKAKAAYAGHVDRHLKQLDMDPDHWIDWSQGSWSLGYGVETGQLPRQGVMGVLGTKIKAAGPHHWGKYLDARIAHSFDERYENTYGGQLRVGVGDLGQSENWLYELGLVGGYTRAGDSAIYLAGVDLSVQWRMFRQVSLHAGVTWNALSLTDLAKEVPVPGPDPDVETGEYVVTSTGHPIWLQLHWFMPSQLYLTVGLRRDFGGELDAEAFATLVYTFGFRRF